MKPNFSPLVAIAGAVALSLSSAAAIADAQKIAAEQSLPAAGSNAVNMADVAALMSAWESRIKASGAMSAAELQSWKQRNLSAFSTMTPEQLRMARGAQSVAELELAFIKAPVAAGVDFSLYQASGPSDVTFVGPAQRASGEAQKLGNETGEQLVFTPVTPCRIMDTRAFAGGLGAMAAAEERNFNIWNASSFASQGGSATNCGYGAIPSGSLKAVMISVSTVNQGGGGYLTLYPFGSANPAPNGVVNFYQPGYVQTAFAVVAGDLTTGAQSRIYSSNATDVIMDVVGYFARPTATSLDCQTWFAFTGFAANSGYQVVTSPSCSVGYTLLYSGCYTGGGGNTPGNYLQSTSQFDLATANAARCEWLVNGAAFTGRANAKCCRIPGR